MFLLAPTNEKKIHRSLFCEVTVSFFVLSFFFFFVVELVVELVVERAVKKVPSEWSARNRRDPGIGSNPGSTPGTFSGAPTLNPPIVVRCALR
jgi:hypothetical protein